MGERKIVGYRIPSGMIDDLVELGRGESRQLGREIGAASHGRKVEVAQVLPNQPTEQKVQLVNSGDSMYSGVC